MKIINFEKENKNGESQQKQVAESNSIEINTNIDLIKNQYKNKILFSIKEASTVLNLSYHYIREQLLSGKIKFVQFGDRRMIHIHEIARLITYGV